MQFRQKTAGCFSHVILDILGDRKRKHGVVMRGRELIARVFEHAETETVPWVPFAGVHAGSLKGFSAGEVLQDGNKLLQSIQAVHEQYRPDGQPIHFDLQLEAEILGCRMQWVEKAPPAVVTHPLATTMEIPSRLPGKSEGRLPMILDVMREFRKTAGRSTTLFALICGPFTLASHLRGTEIFMDMIDNPDYVRELIGYTRDVNIRVAEFYVEAGMDVVAVVDPLTSQISPVHFRTFLSDAFRDVFGYIKERNVYSSFFVCGDATKNIEEMCFTKPDSIFIDENVDMRSAKKITDANNIVIGGNIPLTSVMLLGTQQDNMKYVIDMLDSMDTRNLVVAPGCDMPYDTPPENVIGIVQALREPQSIRKMLKNYHSPGASIEIVLPDYSRLKKPLIEIFTVDSASCPACGYMVSAVMDAKMHFGEGIDVVEYKIIELENLERAKVMQIKNLPCILINGKLKYSSIIPDKKNLLEAVEEYL